VRQPPTEEAEVALDKSSCLGAETNTKPKKPQGQEVRWTVSIAPTLSHMHSTQLMRDQMLESSKVTLVQAPMALRHAHKSVHLSQPPHRPCLHNCDRCDLLPPERSIVVMCDGRGWGETRHPDASLYSDWTPIVQEVTKTGPDDLAFLY
jgi:hypothetical protein